MRTATQEDARRAGGIVEEFELALVGIAPAAPRASVVEALLLRVTSWLRVIGSSPAPG